MILENNLKSYLISRIVVMMKLAVDKRLNSAARACNSDACPKTVHQEGRGSQEAEPMYILKILSE